jgi:hypothetical protein
MSGPLASPSQVSDASSTPAEGSRWASLQSRLAAVRYPGALALVAFMAVGALARAPFWHRPVGFDGGQYLYVGQVILDGGTPYTDAANNKGPALFLTFALIRLVAGTSTVAVRLIALLFVALAALALAAYIGKYLGRGPGVLAGVLLVVMTAAPEVNARYLYAENFALAPMIGAMWLASRGGRPSTAGAGAMAAVAALMHPAFALVVPFLVIEVWSTAGRGHRVTQLASALAGALAIAVPILLWIAVSGAFGEMVDQVGGQIGESVRGSEAAVERPAFLDFPLDALTAVAIVGALAAVRDPRTRALGILIVVWIAIVFIRVKVPDYTFPQHFYPAAPAIAAGIALIARWRSKVAASVAALAVLVALGLSLHPIVDEVLTGDVQGALIYPDYAEVADFIRSHTEPDETIYAGYPEVYWLTDKMAPTRYFDREEIRTDPELEAERNRALLRDPPRAIVLDAYQDSYLAPLTTQYQYEVAFGNPVGPVLVRQGGR